MPARCPWECDTQTETRQVNYAIFCRGMATLGMSNFGFVERHDVRLATLGALAERYFRDDPPTAIVKLRQFAEFLAKLIAAHHALYIGERDTFEETLRPCLLSELFPKEAADLFIVLRKFGNAAVHDAKGSRADALASLKLGIWFHRDYGHQPNFNPGAFIPPPEPVDATAALKKEIDALQRKIAEGIGKSTVATVGAADDMPRSDSRRRAIAGNGVTVERRSGERPAQCPHFVLSEMGAQFQ